MENNNLEVAREEMQNAGQANNWREVARLIGAPVDPRKPYAPIIEAICDVEAPASPRDNMFYFDVDEDVKEVYTLTNTGVVTVQKITPNTQTAVAFACVQSKAYRVHIVDILSAKFFVFLEVWVNARYPKLKPAVNNSVCKVQENDKKQPTKR